MESFGLVNILYPTLLTLVLLVRSYPHSSYPYERGGGRYVAVRLRHLGDVMRQRQP